MESSSAQSLSTITVHLKLNYDTNAALTQIQAKVAQVRNDLPPEAEAPIIELETADNQFAAIYLGFSSADLDPNQITDYLTRVVQPKLSAISGVQRADILGARTFAMRDLAPAGPHGGARHLAVGAPRGARAQQLLCRRSGTPRDRWCRSTSIANTDLRTPEEFRQMIVKEQNGVVVRLGDIADVVAGRRELRAGHPIQRRGRDVHGRLGAADRELARGDRQGSRGAAADSRAAPGRHEGRRSLRLDGVHPGRAQAKCSAR